MKKTRCSSYFSSGIGFQVMLLAAINSGESMATRAYGPFR